MSAEDMCTVHVSSAGIEQPSTVTITVPSANMDNHIVTTDGIALSHDHDGAITTSALQMVEDVDIMNDDYNKTTLVVSDPKADQPTAEECYEPDAKRQCLETSADSDSLKNILFGINRAICIRLDTIESKMKQLQNFCQDLDGKVKKINATLDSMAKVGSTKPSPGKLSGQPRKPRATVVGLPPSVVESSSESISIKEMVPLLGKQATIDSNALGTNVTLITLNSEEDYPNGSWLGDPNNVQMRVRCGISPTDMLHIMETSRTADKCALKLMDYLFDREVQATSNLSGTGKHGKKQLDPLMIYGTRCHLVYKFGITEEDWHRIKLNIDSKCRTAFRRKQRGLPLKVKAFYSRKVSDSDQISQVDEESEDSIVEQQPEATEIVMASTEPHHQLQRIHVQLHELPDGQVTAIPSLPVSLARNEQNHVQLADGRQLAISESTQIQIAQMCSQDIPPGTTLVMTQADVQESPHEGSIVMRITSEGNCLEQVETIVQSGNEGFSQQTAHQGIDSQDKNGMKEDPNNADILVEIQQDECV